MGFGISDLVLDWFSFRGLLDGFTGREDNGAFTSGFLCFNQLLEGLLSLVLIYDCSATCTF